jgi:predicted dehydrogenase
MSAGRVLNKLKSVVVGLGQVGQGYDYDSLDNSVILTHAKALSVHNGFELVAGIDTNLDQRKRFEKKFSKPAFSCFKKLKENYKPDVFSIATPLPTHFSIFNEALMLHPKAIICEKPVAENLNEALQMIDAVETSNCAVTVNYFRRFNPAIIKLKEKIENADFGEIYKITAWYTKGIQENGSHFIDLFHFLLGQAKSFEILKTGRRWNNCDPEPDLLIHFDDTDVYIFAGREECYYMGGFELIGTKGMVHYVDGQPIKMCFSQDDPVYPDYKNLGKKTEIKNPSEKNIWYTYDNLAEFFKNGTALQSTLRTATSTLKIVEKILLQLGNK